MTIQVLGTGCPKCKETAANAVEAVRQAGLEVDIVKVEKPVDIVKFKVMFTPALAIDGTVKCAGKVPSVDEIKAWLAA